MDEIVIEEKKYISSKQAAKVTGYAKDYIGQLCREGRVPARLVGRSWYVLESAIQDHRFGNPEVDEPVKAQEAPQRASSAPTWEPPRYEALSNEILPSVNRLQESDESTGGIQDSWKEWFDRFNTNDGATPTSEVDAPTESVGENTVEEEVEEVEVAEVPETIEVGEVGEEVDIPIHVYQPPPEELLPRYGTVQQSSQEQEEIPVRKPHHKHSRKMLATLQIVGVLLAIVSASLAVIGSGYLDEYILLSRPAQIIAGVALYNK